MEEIDFEEYNKRRVRKKNDFLNKIRPLIQTKAVSESLYRRKHEDMIALFEFYKEKRKKMFRKTGEYEYEWIQDFPSDV